MGKIPVFTKEQQTVLDEIAQSEFLRSQFYFTGGTALSSFYLNHRYSDDLDFFSHEKFDNEVILTLLEDWSKKYGFTFQSRFNQVVYMFNLVFNNKATLKIDFGYYPYQRLKKGVINNRVQVDSLTDIAVNKLLTISQRSDVKDFVDLYFLLKKFTVWDLVERVRLKFNRKTELLLLASDFLRIEDFDYLPKMIKPLTLEQLKTFFRKKAKTLGLKSVN